TAKESESDRRTFDAATTRGAIKDESDVLNGDLKKSKSDVMSETQQKYAAKLPSDVPANNAANNPAANNPTVEMEKVQVAAAAPASQPTEQRQEKDFAYGQSQQLAFYCRSVTPEQAHELEGVLSARPGQMAQVLPPAPSVTQIVDANRASSVPPTNFDANLNAAAPSTEPTTAPSN